MYANIKELIPGCISGKEMSEVRLTTTSGNEYYMEIPDPMDAVAYVFSKKWLEVSPDDFYDQTIIIGVGSIERVEVL